MEQRKGIWLAVAAFSFWGFVPVFWKALDSVPALELLSHRIVWSVLLGITASFSSPRVWPIGSPRHR